MLKEEIMEEKYVNENIINENDKPRTRYVCGPSAIMGHK